MSSRFVSLRACVPLLMAALVGSGCAQAVKADVALGSKISALHFVSLPGGKFGVSLVSFGSQFEQATPLAVEVVDVEGAARWIRGAYQSVQTKPAEVDCQGEVTSTNGTRFLFEDRFTNDSGGYRLDRRISIAAPSSQDAGFASRFSLVCVAPTSTTDCDFLVPGIWYRDNSHVPANALAAHLDDAAFLFREDRLPLPLVMMRDKRNGATLEMERVGGSPTTFAQEQGRDRIIDERMQYGSLGFLNSGHLEMAFNFPGSEGERTYTGKGARGIKVWALRSHPVKVGVQHAYSLHFGVAFPADYPVAVETTWKAAFQRAHAPLVKADLKAVYRDSMELLDAVTHVYDGTISVPFQIGAADGVVRDTSSQMGFVGMALPSAALLLKYGLETNNRDMVARANQVVDFWVSNAAQPSGVPKNWYNIEPVGKTLWRDYPTHLRVASDGMEGALQAWNLEHKHNVERPEWLQFCRAYGDFLLKVQNPDGSFFGSWNWDGTPHDRYTNASTHPIKFLVDLSRATGEAKYRMAAVQAGEFCWKEVHQNYLYVGGTPDNPNVTDKEAGIIAVDAFLALYDVTQEKKWLDAARQAAIFCETWVYWRDIPIPDGVEKRVFPKGRTTVGISLIATGHSGADNFMAAVPFLWYRLYLETGDSHFRDVARLLMFDTKQLLDWDGTLGYKYPGALTEAMSLSDNRGKGVDGWLPWLTVTVLEPMVRLQENFGAMDINELEKMPLEKRRALNAKFGLTRGFGTLETLLNDGEAH